MTSLVLMRCLYAHRQQLAVDLSQLHLEQARTLTVWVNQMHLNMTLRDRLDWKDCISYLVCQRLLLFQDKTQMFDCNMYSDK